MPRCADWIHRLNEISQKLQEDSVELMDRSKIEKVFCVSSRQAARILGRVGADRVGGALVIRRRDLLQRLEAMSRDNKVRFERDRRERLGYRLEQARGELRGRRVVIPPLPSGEASLQGVRLEAGCLEIHFQDPIDLIQKLMALAKSAVEDWDQFESQARAESSR